MEKKEMSKIKIRRFDPDRDAAPYDQEYEIPYEKESTILDALYKIYQTIDGTLSFRGSCFAGGWCNVCAIRVNGKALLPCKVFMEKEMIIEPLSGYPVLKDLIVEFSAKRKGGCGDASESGE